MALHNETADKNIAGLVEKLAPLLRAGDTRSLGFVEEIRGTLGSANERSGVLVEQIEDFDFPKALETLKSIGDSLAAGVHCSK
jgi:hypothetical protein